MAIRNNVYRGLRTKDGGLVTRDGVILSPERSLKKRNHSPTGFNWGYIGSGPSQLALALLLDAATPAFESVASTFYHDFAMDLVSRWRDEWEITRLEIYAWLAAAIWLRSNLKIEPAAEPFDGVDLTTPLPEVDPE